MQNKDTTQVSLITFLLIFATVAAAQQQSREDDVGALMQLGAQRFSVGSFQSAIEILFLHKK